jgi:carotenoid cleavage dioxygenase
VLHFTNAFEDGDEIVLDGFYEGDPAPVDSLTGDKWQKAFRFLALDRLQTRLRRWRFNLVTGATTEEQLTDSITEFGMINAGYAGREYRYTYAATGQPGWFLFDGLVKHDLHTGRGALRTDDASTAGDGEGAAYRQHREDDGYL